VIKAPPPQRADTPVGAYRVFRVHGGKLTSATHGDEWTADLHEATCGLGQGHQAPHFGCHCGIHAFGSLATAEAYSRRRWRLWPGLSSSTVIGAVLLWSGPSRPIVGGELSSRSRVRTGRRPLQYRAPYAQLIALVDDGETARRVAARLAVPAIPKLDAAGRPAFERFVREHGTELEAVAETAAPQRPTPAAPPMRPVADQRRPGFLSSLAGTIARQRGRRRHAPLVAGLAVGLVLLVAARLSWLVLRPTLRASWWLTWWGLRVGWALFVFVLLVAISFLGLVPEQRS
jgi:hypothetical protein